MRKSDNTVDDFLSHADFFGVAEDQAVMIRKLLRRLQSSADEEVKGSMDDVIATTDLIERLAREGRFAEAAEAMELREMVESLSDFLLMKVDEFLAS